MFLSYKNRMMVFVVSVLLLASMLAGLTFFSLKALDSGFVALHERFGQDLDHDRIILKVTAMLALLRESLLNGRPPSLEYEVTKESAIILFNTMFNAPSAEEYWLTDTRNAFDDFISIADNAALGYFDPVSNDTMLHELDRARGVLVKSLIDSHFMQMEGVASEIIEGERSRARLAMNVYALVSFCLIATVFIMIQMRRAVIAPASIILDATNKISSGVTDYRIEVERDDEFGVIFKHFNSMVESLERSKTSLESRLNLTQLVLIIGSLSSEGQDIGRVLVKISSLVSDILNKDIFAIFVRDPDTRSFDLAACIESPESMESALRFVENSKLVKKLSGSREPFVIWPGTDEVDLPGMLDIKTCMVVAPAMHDDEIHGFIVMGSSGNTDCIADDLDTAGVLATTIGVMIRNFNLHEETKSSLMQLSKVFELAKEVTSLYEPEELLYAIAQGVAPLIHSRGCIIRLVEGDVLVPRAVSGDHAGLEDVGPMPIDKGVPGWVATKGEPFLVEDMESLPEEMKFQMTAHKTAIVTPMIKDDVIIGTLGIVDKLDSDGNEIPFTRSDLDLAEGFASLSALAIDKAMTHAHGREVEAVMAKTERRMRMLFDNVQEGIVTLDRNFIIKSANRFVERWAHMSSDEMLDKDAREVFHGDNDAGAICPHCAARAMFEEGGVYTVNMSHGLNYAKLDSYPLMDEEGEISEAIVVIQDTTERVLYEEDIMGLYREVMQANEYIESLIRNSADAIVTTDLKGRVQSWNPAAELIYGFSTEEVLDRFLPYVPDRNENSELINLGMIGKGELLTIETLRKTKDSGLIEVSMTLSPIKDISGEIIGVSQISKDITSRKRVENELVRRNQELSRLFFVSSAMRGNLDLDRVLHMVLMAVTMSEGLGFNRSVLFLIDDQGTTLNAKLGVGPVDADEAAKVWQALDLESRGLHEMMTEVGEGPLAPVSLLHKLGISIDISLDADSALAASVREKVVYNVHGHGGPVPVDPEIETLLLSDTYACVPLLSRGNVIGVLWVDNKFNMEPITDEDIKFLVGFADQAASAIEAASLFTKVSLAEAELENIFSSITDMVYFTDKDFTIKNVNQAVLDRVGLKREEVIGSKCYKIFHGTDEPLETCPHHRTVKSLGPSVMEVEDDYLGGTFITSTAPMFSSDREFMGTVHLVRDISELKDLRVKLQSVERKAALGEVAAKVAHEIRNPLVSVGGFARRLEESLEGSMKEYASIIAMEASRLEAILKDILGFVREVRMNKKMVDLNIIIRSVTDLMSGEVDDRKNRISLLLSPDGVLMYIDPDRIREAIMNIVVNANQAMEDGDIFIRTYIKGKNGVFEVEDTGPGVSEEVREQIYDPFFTTRTMGTGLGLAVTKRIVEENNGTIELDKRTFGDGAIFRVYLPIEEGEDEDTGS